MDIRPSPRAILANVESQLWTYSVQEVPSPCLNSSSMMSLLMVCLSTVSSRFPCGLC